MQTKSSRSNTNQEQCFSINNVCVEIVKQHEYLGITLQNNGSFKHSIASLADQARKTSFSMMTRMANLGFPPPLILCHVFDTLVVPIMEYSCEILGWMESNELEQLHRKFCKHVLNVPTTAANEAVYTATL